VILPGATLGVLGGGQLGRMFALRARVMGYRVVVLEPDPRSPAGQVADEQIEAPYRDLSALDLLAQRCDAVTTEFENVPAQALATLAATRPVAPRAEAVAVCQDRAAEKAQFVDCGVPCAPHAVIERVAPRHDHFAMCGGQRIDGPDCAAVAAVPRVRTTTGSSQLPVTAYS